MNVLAVCGTRDDSLCPDSLIFLHTQIAAHLRSASSKFIHQSSFEDLTISQQSRWCVKISTPLLITQLFSGLECLNSRHKLPPRFAIEYLELHITPAQHLL
jgi:hypothetical protein